MFQTRIFHVGKQAQEEVDQRSKSNAITVCFLHLSDEDRGDGAEHITLWEISHAKLKKKKQTRCVNKYRGVEAERKFALL